MRLSLSDKLGTILQEGWIIIQQHRDDILSAWLDQCDELQDKQHAAARPLKLAIDAFSSQWLHPVNDANEWLAALRREWEIEVGELSPNQTTVTLTMMENAIHETIQSSGITEFRSHQAIQYVFSKLHELINSSGYMEPDWDRFLEQLASFKQFPVSWIARLAKSADGSLYVEKMTKKKSNLLSYPLLLNMKKVALACFRL
ncbi:hypothetical protein [Geobacillus sp. TFV-3]|uniref:hypothetical protein n=1 Tax=Geobacillus sp. TFV-3 TaxID=1897059 RepID=UPI00135AAFD4|nr:hypothetical protein [Geobacillus sp. TFV-3]KAF0994138.1 hypothetical protein BJQ97_00780 [Geobacillus sp. TFV-3]